MDTLLLLWAALGGFVWVGLAILVGWVADKRGYTGLWWFLLALIISPFVAGLLLVAIMPRDPRAGR
jgi:MFS-type transporter involved in bile tolerance (Atg22 family)